MAPVACQAIESPSTRAALAKERLYSLPDDQIVYIDRLGPRILAVPPDPTVRLSRPALRELDKGNLLGHLSKGARFPSKRMMQCPEITLYNNGHYTVKKIKNDPNTADPRAFTVKTLDIWTGKPGEPHEDRNLEDLVLYSVAPDQLPTYHSWKGDKLERRESSLELEKQEELALAEQEFLESPKSIADTIDEYKEKIQAKMDENASNDPENMLRFKPDILPSDPAWEGVEEYFKWILQLERQESLEAPQIYRLLQNEFLGSQKLLVIPAIGSGYRAQIQDENTKRYHEALETTFKGKPDNLVTKLTMLCFGLPIEPLTVQNVQFAGGLEDVPAKRNENQGHGQIMEHILWSEKPLEFLGRYNERSYGYPMRRTLKRKYEEVDNETMEIMLAQAQQRSKHPRLFWDGCGFPKMDELEEDLHLRGGAGSLFEPPKRTYWVYTDIGRFIMNADNSHLDFWRLISRLYQLELRKEWTLQIDLVPFLEDEERGFEVDPTRNSQSRNWHRTDEKRFDILSYKNYYESYVAFVMNPKDMYKFRVRHNPNSRSSSLDPSDPLGPQDNQNVVNLEVIDVGVAYWYLPSSGVAINIREETFRNAVECLLPQHRQHRIQWSIEGSADQPEITGELLLMAEAPSIALWNATLKALRSRRVVTITLHVVEDRESPVKAGESSRQVGILMPGHNMKGWYERNRDEEFNRQNTAIFPAIRAYAQTRTKPDILPLRIWSGVENYDDRRNIITETVNHLSMVLPNKSNKDAEQDIWHSEGLASTWDAIVVRPDFNWFMIYCLTDKTKKDHNAGDYRSTSFSEAEDGLFTLAQFRIIVSAMANEFDEESNNIPTKWNEEQDYVSIQQTQTGETFWIGPGMTQYQWHTQVYSWIYSHNIYFEVHRNWPIKYAMAIIEGPLGPTFSMPAPSFLSLTLPEPIEEGTKVTEESGRSTPPLVNDPCSGGLRHVTAPTKAGSKAPNNMGHKSTASLPALLAPTKQPTLNPLTVAVMDPGTEIGTQHMPVMPTAIDYPTVLPVESPRGSPKGSPKGGQITGSMIIPAVVDPLSRKSLGPSASDAYREYQKKEADQEQKRIEAYIRNGSIYEGGRDPQIPQFGPPFEGNVPVAGGTVPTIFTRMTTPTENVHRDRELEALQKIALERLEYCGVCQTGLPAGPHNLELRKRHFREHKDIEDEYKRNALGNFNAAAQLTFQEVFYCEYCGKTLTESEKDKNVLKHGPSCALKATFHDVPQYCQYCRLNFLDNHMSNETILRHVQDCANIRRVSLHGQIALYQRLLSRAVGHEQPNGDSTCHLEGCHQNFSSGTTNTTMANHFLQHLDRTWCCSDESNAGNTDAFTASTNNCRKRCPFERCNRDLTGMAEPEMLAHLQEHIGWDDCDTCRIPECGMQLEGISEIGLVDHLMEHIHDDTQNHMNCPFKECNFSFKDRSWGVIITHFNVHFGINRRQCPFPNCWEKELFGMNDQELRTHFEGHFGSGRHLCPFVDCGHDLQDFNDGHFKAHFNIHYGGDARICPFNGCGVNLANYTIRADEAHIRRHIFVQRCPFPHCKIDLYDYSSQRKRIHVTEHLGPKRGQSDHRCPVEGCGIAMRAWNGTKRLEHFKNHFVANGQLPPCARASCHFENCSQSFIGISRVQISQHLKTHQTGSQQTQGTRGNNCPLCVFPWDGTSEELLRAHFHFTHYPKKSTDFVCPLCTTRLSNTPGTAIMHFRNHVNDLHCTWEGCQHQHPSTATADDRRRHLATHVGLVCQWPDCNHIASISSTLAATNEERRQHLLEHVRRLCPWTNCNKTFPEGVTQREIEQHLLLEHIMGCQWPKCRHRFPKGRSDADSKNHYRDHAKKSPGKYQPTGESMKDLECQWPGCGHDFDATATPEDIENHLHTHLPQRCSYPNCSVVFPQEMTDGQKMQHMHTHCDMNCQWPDCPSLYVKAPTPDEIIAHYFAHVYEMPGSQAPTLQFPAQQNPGSQDQEPQGSDPQAAQLSSEDQDNIPDRLRDVLSDDQDLYCPNCYLRVSGKNASACRRHRKPPCNVTGHTFWIKGTVGNRKQWQKDKKNGIEPFPEIKERIEAANRVAKPANKSSPATKNPPAAPKKPAPRRATPKDSTYKPPPPAEDKPTDEEDPVTPPLQAPRKSKRKTGGERNAKDAGKDRGDGAGPVKKKQKKK